MGVEGYGPLVVENAEGMGWSLAAGLGCGVLTKLLRLYTDTGGAIKIGTLCSGSDLVVPNVSSDVLSQFADVRRQSGVVH